MQKIILSFLFIPLIMYGKIFDSFNSKSGWTVYAKNGSTLNLELDNNGYLGSALKMIYTLSGAPGKVSAQKTGLFNLSHLSSLSLMIKNKDADSVMKIRLKDSDGTIYYAEISPLQAVSGWTKFIFTTNSFAIDAAGTTEAGGDSVLNWGNIIRFGIRLEADDLSSSTLIDEIYYSLSVPDYYQTSTGSLLSSLKILRNPYSPLKDGQNIIKIILSSPAELKMNFFDMTGHCVASINDISFPYTYSSGEHDFVWDGKDKSGKLLDNGIYIFRIYLQSGRKTEIQKTIISILN